MVLKLHPFHHRVDWMDSLQSNNHQDFVDSRCKEKHDLFLIMIMAILGLLTIFVETMLVPALPSIAQDLAVNSADLAWVLTVYTLSGAVANLSPESWARCGDESASSS